MGRAATCRRAIWNLAAEKFCVCANAIRCARHSFERRSNLRACRGYYHTDYGLPESVKSHFDDCYRNFERDFAKSFPQGLRTKPSHRTLAIIYHSTNPQLGALAYDIAGGYDAFDQTRVLTEIEPLIRRSESLLSRCPATR